ncbi:glycoside hydrolase [Decorospora gaudefroyi]|uniref:glucan 1,3-beta-glucosidase n=1 Tax=Decorospora gaudefroyi TaxID=184978 RepID=A0A6A5KLZ5_9PLEO|nr:glycoside hydrolase [Decorospora gaudefroyi]
MRASATLTAALMAGAVTAAPTPGLIGDLFGLITNDISKLLSSIGIKLRNDFYKHGAIIPFHDKCPFDISPVELSPKRYTHDITWGAGVNGGNFIDWKTFKANGANLGGWLEKEKTHDPIWWSEVGGDAAPDEWTLCQNLGSKCASVFEERYASFINTATIDKLASAGVNALRIPLTYAAFIKYPGSQLHHGNQLSYLKTVTDYAINKYNMHIIIGLHSLPGGINSLDIGEAFGHSAWFQNATNLDYSFKAIDGMLDFIKRSGRLNAWTIAPLNEASDNFAGFGSAAGLTADGTNWVNTYFDGVLKKIAKLDKRIPMMIQDNFMGASYWAPFYDATANIVIDTHVYYFAAAGTYSGYVNPAVCGQATYIAQETKFPIFIGEWALQAMYNNTLEGRKTIFDTQRYAWNKYVSGGAFWTAVSYATDKVDGEGTQREYWSFIDLIEQGVATKATDESYC